MGVLKVYDGTTWKKIGCGGAGGTVGRLKLWDGTQWVREKCDGSGTNMLSAQDSTFDLSNDTGIWDVDQATRHNIVRDTSLFHSGVASLKDTSTYTGSGLLRTTWIGYQYDDATNVETITTFAMQSGLDYIVSTWMYSGPGYTARVRLDWLIYADAAGSSLVGGVNFEPGFTTLPAQTWTNVVRPFRQDTGSIQYIVPGWEWGNANAASTIPPGSTLNFDDAYIGQAVATARPLRMWDGAAWQQVACMVPA